MSDLEIGVTNHEQAGTELVADPDTSGNFGNDYILRVVQADGLFSRGPIDGLRASASGTGVNAFSSESDGVFGVSGAPDKSGVVGVNDSNVGVFGRGNARAGVLGTSSGGNGVEGNGTFGSGVLGRSNSGNGVVGLSDSDSGVSGMSNSGVGMRGGSEGNDGVLGVGPTIGVHGESTSGVGVKGRSEQNTGVVGETGAGGTSGVLGVSAQGQGVHGVGAIGIWGEATDPDGVAVAANADDAVAVQAISNKYIAVHAICGDDSNPGVAAGRFAGNVIIVGDLVVTGVKSAAIPHRDGSHRQLYCVESPESWFEDFGDARLIKGRANVKLEAGFLSVVKKDRYHVFLTSYGESNGLYVSRRGKTRFEVRERGHGKSSVAFSYRIVAKRANVDGRRFAKVKLPEPRLVRPQAIAKAKPPA